MVAALEIENLTKIYGSAGHRSTKALDSVSFCVNPGDFFALLGPNGAGKTTTIGIITSLVNKTSGTVRVFGHDIDQDWIAARRAIGVVPQEFNFNIFEKVIDIVTNQAGYYGLSRAQAAPKVVFYLKKLDLWEKRFEIARNLSGGMKRRLMIARALIHEPKILILDEPTAGVDIELRRLMWDFLKMMNATGTTIILTTHYLEEAEHLCRGIGIIDHGKIIELTTIRKLLEKLQTQTVILDFKQNIETLPVVEGFEVQKLDSNSIAVSYCQTQDLNAVFTSLSNQNLKVSSMRNKSNRLEELFLQLVQKRES